MKKIGHLLGGILMLLYAALLIYGASNIDWSNLITVFSFLTLITYGILFLIKKQVPVNIGIILAVIGGLYYVFVIPLNLYEGITINTLFVFEVFLDLLIAFCIIQHIRGKQGVGAAGVALVITRSILLIVTKIEFLNAIGTFDYMYGAERTRILLYFLVYPLLSPIGRGLFLLSDKKEVESDWNPALQQQAQREQMRSSRAAQQQLQYSQDRELDDTRYRASDIPDETQKRLHEMKRFRDNGLMTQKEYEEQKRRILSGR